MATHYWNGLLLPLMILQRKIMASAPEADADVTAFPPWQDRMLFGITEVERHLVRFRVRIPVGGSVLAVVTRRRRLRPFAMAGPWSAVAEPLDAGKLRDGLWTRPAASYFPPVQQDTAQWDTGAQSSS